MVSSIVIWNEVCFFFPIAAGVQKDNEENSENDGYFNSGVVSLRLEIFQEHANYNELRSVIRKGLPGVFVKNGNQYDQSPDNGFFIRRNENIDQLEVCLINFNLNQGYCLKCIYSLYCSRNGYNSVSF